MMAKVVQRFFPGYEIIINRKHLDVRFPNSSASAVQYDVSNIIYLLLTCQVYIPSLALALEYQGELHFIKIPIFGDTVEKKQKLDKMKLEVSKQAGISLISIPFWWDKREGSLAATIKLHRPGIIRLDIRDSCQYYIVIILDIQFPDSVIGSPISTVLPRNTKTYLDNYIPAVPLQISQLFEPTGW
jgi:hypothetical protein